MATVGMGDDGGGTIGGVRSVVSWSGAESTGSSSVWWVVAEVSVMISANHLEACRKSIFRPKRSLSLLLASSMAAPQGWLGPPLSMAAKVSLIFPFKCALTIWLRLDSISTWSALRLDLKVLSGRGGVMRVKASSSRVLMDFGGLDQLGRWWWSWTRRKKLVASDGSVGMVGAPLGKSGMTGSVVGLVTGGGTLFPGRWP